jgi:hypothetical protein
MPGWSLSKMRITKNPGTNKKRNRTKTWGLVAIAVIKGTTINYLLRASVVAGIERATPNLPPVPFIA